MKKRLAIVLATVMILGFVLPVMAGPFADVPENHWAYEAVKQLAAYGLIQGFPDGTYKGQEPMTRYQMAIVVARLLSDLDAEIIELRDSIDSGLESEKAARLEETESIYSAIEQGKADAIEASFEAAEEIVQRTVSQAADSTQETIADNQGETAETSIIEKIIEKHIIETEGAVDKETLDTKVAESIALIDAVKAEFAMELAVLGIRVSALEEQLTLAAKRIEDMGEATRELSFKLGQAMSKLEETNQKLDDYIAEHEKVSISGSSKILFKDIDITGTGTPWKDPFDADNDKDDSDYVHGLTSDFDHELALRFKADVADGIIVSAGLDTITNILGAGWKSNTFQLKDNGLYLDITTPGIIRHLRVGDIVEPKDTFTEFTLHSHMLRDDDGDPVYEGALGEFAYNRATGTGLFWRLPKDFVMPLENNDEEPKDREFAGYAVAFDSKLALTENITAGASVVTVFNDIGSLGIDPEDAVRDTVIGINGKATIIPGWEGSAEVAQHTLAENKNFAYRLNLDGKVWIADIGASFRKVDPGFKPVFVDVPYDKDDETGIDNDVKIASVNATLPIGTILGGDLTVDAGLKRSGNANWTYENEDLEMKTSVGAKYARNVMGADVMAGAGVAYIHNDNTSENAIANSFETKGSVEAKFQPFTVGYAITDVRDIETKAVVSKETVLDLDFKHDLTPNVGLSAGYKAYNLDCKDERTEKESEAYSVKRAGIDVGFDLNPITRVTGAYDLNKVDYVTDWQDDCEEIEGIKTSAKAGLEMALTPATRIFGQAGIESGALRLPDVDGRMTKGKIGLEHSFTDNANLELGYEIGMFFGKDNPELDYKVNKATAELSVSF